MSLQVFLQAHLLGSASFLSAPIFTGSSLQAFLGRSAWLNLYMETLGRALLTELSLPRVLLGTSNAEQFLLVLAEEDVPRARELLTEAAADVARLSGSTLQLQWESTENLGSWPVARKRLNDSIRRRVYTPLARIDSPEAFFEPYARNEVEDEYFSNFGAGLPEASAVAWQRAQPARLEWGAHDGMRTWQLLDQAARRSGGDADGIVFARHIATDDLDERRTATVAQLAERASGASRWGVLTGEVDGLGALLGNQGSVEDYLQLSILFKEFFAGELAVSFTLPQFWRRVTLLFRGGAGFAAFGSWDALLGLGREMQRLFARFAEEHLLNTSSDDGRTMSMAFALAENTSDGSLPSVYADASARLEESKAVGTSVVHLFGRTVEWKRLADAEELESMLVQLVERHGFPPDVIRELTSVYRETSLGRSQSRRSRGKAAAERPWRLYMRVARVLAPGGGKEPRAKDVHNLRTAVITNLLGKRATGGAKLRPSGRVALEWARLATGEHTEIGRNEDSTEVKKEA